MVWKSEGHHHGEREGASNLITINPLGMGGQSHHTMAKNYEDFQIEEVNIHIKSVCKAWWR